MTTKVRRRLEQLGAELEEQAKAAAAEVKHGGWRAAIDDALHAFENAGAELVGVAELTTPWRYPVAPYQARVSPTLTRGSRLEDAAAYAALAAQGFRSIVDLTAEGTRDAALAPRAGLKTLNVKVLDHAAPTHGQMKQFLDFVTNPAYQPVYVHCEAGKGRTGVAVAVYRMAVEGQSAEQAMAEARQFGLTLPNQLAFLGRFEQALRAGRIAGYPRLAR